MTPVVVITDNIDFISVDLLARQIKSVADANGIPCERVRPGTAAVKAMGHCRVINLKEGELAAYASNFRWVHPTAFATVIAGNWDDYTDTERLHLLGHHLRPNFSGIPVALVAHSPYTMASIRKTARELLAPSASRSIMTRVHQINCGIEDGFAPNENDPDFVVVPFNHPVGLKQVPLHVKVSRAYSIIAARKGFKPQHQYWHHPTKAFGGLPSEADGVYTVTPQPETRDEFRTNISKAGMFLCTSSYESFGLYFLELMASGAVGVFLDKPWVRDLLPGYKYVGKADDLLGLMLHVRENYDAARDYLLNEVRPALLQNYTIGKFAQGLLDLTAEMECRT